jgi:hypothetical protein
MVWFDTMCQEPQSLLEKSCKIEVEDITNFDLDVENPEALISNQLVEPISAIEFLISWICK